VIETSNTVGSPELLASIVAVELRRLIAERSRAVLVIEASGLPDDFFDHLVAAENINWTQVIVFLAQERVGFGSDSPNSLRRRLVERLVARVPIVEFYAPRADAPNPEAAFRNFVALFERKQGDLAVARRSSEMDGFGLESGKLRELPTFFLDSMK
jgi:6-phosphogluconolactonase/glucosamine-6-phosphate isomerase/deaminase